MKPRAVTIMLISVWLNAGNACAAPPCAVAAGGGSPGWTAIHVKRGDLEPGNAMLGAQGDRVTVGATLGPAPGRQGTASEPWHTRVNWEKHDIGRSDAARAAVVHLDADATGKRYLCRIDTRRPTDAYLRSNIGSKAPPPGPADLRTDVRTDLSYDARRRMSGVVTWRWHDEQAILKRESSECFYYDKADAYVGASVPAGNGCPADAPVKLDQRYVYQVDGKLLRQINAEKRMPGLYGKPFVTSAARVIIYNEQGEPRAEYAADDAQRYYRRSIAPKDDVTRYHGVIAISSAASIDPRSLSGSAAPGFWQFYSVPSRVVNEDASNDPRYLLASGDQPAISKADREKVWKALQRPDHDLLFDAQGKFLLVPGTPVTLWKACVNHQLVTRNDCP